MRALEVCDLVVRYGDKTAVGGVSFSAEPGEVVALLGPNGAGKTTTVETLEGYRVPSAGTVRVLGLDPRRDRRALMPAIGVMLQRGGVYPSMTPLDVLRLFAGYYAEADDPHAVLARVGLSDVGGTPWRRLSGGEQQRVSLALALIGKPRVAFLDEPTAGVDPAARHRVREIVRSLRDDGVAVLLTSHDLDEVEAVADRVVIIDHGRVVGAGTPAALRSSVGTDELRFGAPPGIDVSALSARVGVAVREDRPGEYLVAGAATPPRVAAVTAWLAEHDLPLADLRAGRQTLQDVFLRLTAETADVDGNPRGEGAA